MMTNEQRAAVRQRLEQIEASNGGRLTPSDVIRDARQKTSPLHGFFEWDVKKAAQQHWMDQARQLITSVRVVISTETMKVQSVYYVRDPSAARGEQGYVSVARLRTEREMARDALVSEFARVADMLRRARELAAALDASSEV